MRNQISIVLLAVCLAGCNDGGSDNDPTRSGGKSGTNPYLGHQSAIYTGTDNWLCHPDLNAASDACKGAQDATVVNADGRSTIEKFSPATDPAVDCFYVYPTTSPDPSSNSDLNPDLQEIQTTLLQAGRYGSVCRLFAPVYRQRTLTLLALDSAVDELVTDEQSAQATEIAYADVLDAFRHYIAHENEGRGFLLLGHSQGSRLLSRLIAEEVEHHPYLSAHMIAAHVPGYTIEAPRGQDVGGELKSTPACRDARQTGCVVSFVSYRKGDPELSAPRFGATGNPDTLALCTNPAALAGGMGQLEAYLPFVLPPVFQALLKPRGTFGPYANPVTNATTALATPMFAIPGQLSGECVVDEAGTSYLEVSIAADPADPRADDYPGEFFGGTGWGLHLADVSLAQGNLVKLARTQSEAWLSRH